MGFKLLKVYFCAVQVLGLYECIAADVWPRCRPTSECITHIGSASSQTPHLPIILHYSSSPLASLLRDRSSITGRRGGGYKIGKWRVRIFLRHPSHGRVKLFIPCLLKGGKLLLPLQCGLKTPVLKLPQKALCPVFSMAKTFSAHPPFLVGVKPHSTLLPFYSPPPPLLPIINDRSLTSIDFERLAELIRALSPSLSDHIQLFIHDTVNCRKFIIFMIGCGCQGVKSVFSFEKKIVLSSSAVFRKK